MHSPARMRYTTLEVITMRRKFWLLAAVCLLRRGHPWGAALCGMASALTRMPGVEK